MKQSNIFLLIGIALPALIFSLSSCNDDISGIGNSISSSEVNINVDSLTHNLHAKTIEAPKLDSRSAYTLIGSVYVPEYGDLSCSYVTQFLPSESLNIPDSITSSDVDSVKMILTVPKRYVTGDTLAPQQLKVYSLTKSLPSDINSTFDPEGYYNPASPLSVKSYTLSGYSFSDSTFTSTTTIELKSLLPVDMGKDVFDAYKNEPEIFVWPQKFAEYWPGVFVQPSFGKGCVSPVQNTSVFAYFPKTTSSIVTDADGKTETVYKQVADSVCMFTTAPEVLSSVNISYTPSDNLKDMVKEGKSIITTPGGYAIEFTFPAIEILNEYWKEEYDLGVINNMTFSIPAKIISNAYGLGITPAVLMIKSSEVDSFFEEGKLPDNKSSFTSMYSSEKGAFTFSTMRQYIVDLKDKGADNITEDDVTFTLLPVNVSTEDYTDPNTGSVVTMVTNISPYIIMPTMAEFDTENAEIVFTYSNQILY